MKEIFLLIFGPIISLFVFIKHLFVYEVRLNQELSVKMKDAIAQHPSLVLKEDKGHQNRDFLCYAILNKHPLKFAMTERLLQAGFSSSTDVVSYITCFRFSRKSILNFLQKLDAAKEEKNIPVYLMQPWENEKIGEISVPEKLEEPYVDKEIYQEIDGAIQDLINNKKNNIGVMLYGLPGNGKTWLARHFALKYRLPISIFSLTKDYNNHRIIRAFGSLNKSCIVLMEDFDGYFNKRIPTDKNAEYTLDSILNVIDGAYNSYNGVVFFMTANDIAKIDAALKNRPSRFKIVREIKKPTKQIVERAIGEYDVNKHRGKTLDQILTRHKNV